MESKTIKDMLGGYNCGACGYESCEECANAILSGKADASVCMLIESEIIEKINKQIEQTKNENK